MINAVSFEKENQELLAVSEKLFQGTMILQIVNPKDLVFLKENARYFKRETFRQLRENIQNDQKLSSVPLCYKLGDGKYEIISGNHRVRASIDAGLEKILVLVITEELSKSKRIAMQLSHNALVGEDDESILASLWEQIDSINDRLYAGLDSNAIKELSDDIEFVNFSTPQVSTHLVTFAFSDGETERLSQIVDELENAAKKSALVLVGMKEQYEPFMKIVADIKHSEKIKDSSLAMVKLLSVAEEYLAKKGGE